MLLKQIFQNCLETKQLKAESTSRALCESVCMRVHDGTCAEATIETDIKETTSVKRCESRGLGRLLMLGHLFSMPNYVSNIYYY